MRFNRLFHIGFLSALAVTSVACAETEAPTVGGDLAEQELPLMSPEPGAAWRLASLPFVRVTVVDPATGQQRQRFELGQGPDCTVTHAAVGEAIRSTYTCRVSGGAWSDLDVVAEVDYLEGKWGTDAFVRVTSLPACVAIESLGLEVRLPDTQAREHVLYSSYSGGHVVHEPATAAGGPTLGRRDQSVQAIPYWADDGSALLVWAADPTGESPKDIVGRPIPGSPATLAIGWEANAPNAHLGGQGYEVPFPVRVTRHKGDWFDAAKLYRSWLEAEATGPGQILEMGPIAERSDVSRFVKELDLIGVSNTQWYQGTAADQKALRALARLPGHFGADDVVYMMWGTNDPADPYGGNGTYLTWPTLASDTAALLSAGVRTLIYTMPQVFSASNPALAETGAWQHLAEQRNGQPLLFEDTVTADPSSDFWVLFYEQLAAAHASTFSGARGFYTDNPYYIADDFDRPSGAPLGMTQSSYTGLCDMNRAMRDGGKRAGGEFMTVHESGTERLIRCSDMEGAGGQFTQIYAPFHTANMPADHVPFFQAVYSGYALMMLGDPRFGPLTIANGLWGDTFVESFENVGRALATTTAMGGVPSWGELLLNKGLLTAEWTEQELLGQDPEVVIAPLIAHVTQLIAAREAARPWLVYGEMLRDPAIGGDRTVMNLRGPYQPFDREQYDVPKVATGAFRADSGTVRIIAANGGRDAASTTLDLSRVGLGGVTSLTDSISGVSITVKHGRASFTVPAGAVYVLR